MKGPTPVRRGVSIGLGLAVLAGLVTALYDAGIVPGIVQLGAFVVALGGIFAAGLLSGRDTGRVGTGVVAALRTSVLFGIILACASVVLVLVSPLTFARDYDYGLVAWLHDGRSIALIDAAVVQALAGLLLWVAIGAGIGALGALVGRTRAPARMAQLTVH